MDIKECPCCKAPCTVSETKGYRVPSINEEGKLEFSYHHPLATYTFVGRSTTVDDKILLQELEELLKEFQNSYQTIRAFGDRTRSGFVNERVTYRKLQTITLTIAKLKEFLNL